MKLKNIFSFNIFLLVLVSFFVYKDLSASQNVPSHKILNQYIKKLEDKNDLDFRQHINNNTFEKKDLIKEKPYNNPNIYIDYYYNDRNIIVPTNQNPAFGLVAC